MAEMSVRASWPAAIFSAQSMVISRADWMSMYESAMKPWMNCLVSSRPPCTSRVSDRSTIRSKARHICPTRVHAVVDAAGAQAVLGGLVAGPGAQAGSSTGTRTSS